jgi:hypothetical protein
MKKLITAALMLSMCIMSANTNLLNNKKPKSRITESDSSVCLEINGKLTNQNKKSVNFCKVELISCNQIVESVSLKNTTEFQFNLKKNTHYAIRISKQGFVSRLISIYTSVPQNNKGIFRFEFDTELIEKSEAKQLDEDALDFPIAVVAFNEEMQCFYYNEDYTAKIKRKLYLGKDF